MRLRERGSRGQGTGYRGQGEIMSNKLDEFLSGIDGIKLENGSEKDIEKLKEKAKNAIYFKEI